MSQPTDDQLGVLLTDTFRAHEALADPERAVGLASSPPPRRHRGRVLLAAGAAVAVVAVGTSYVVGQGADRGRPSAGSPTPSPSGAGQPALPPLQTDAANRAAAAALADRTAHWLPVYPRAREVTSRDIPELQALNVGWTPSDFTVTRSRFWTVAGGAKSVAEWYDGRPRAGFKSDGIGGGSGVGGWIYEVFYDQTSSTQADRADASTLIQTTQLAGGMVGIRATVKAVWRPARPVASYVQDVSSIDVRTTHQTGPDKELRTHGSFSVTDPGHVMQAAKAFNALPGQALFVHSCPMILEVWTDRIVFHTATGDVVAASSTGGCGLGMSVSRDGHQVQPYLGDAQRLLDVLGLDH